MKKELFLWLPPKLSTTQENDSNAPYTLCWISWYGSMPNYFSRLLGKYEPVKGYPFQNIDSVFHLIQFLIYNENNPEGFSKLIAGVSEALFSFLSPQTARFPGNTLHAPHWITLRRQSKSLSVTLPPLTFSSSPTSST